MGPPHRAIVHRLADIGFDRLRHGVVSPSVTVSAAFAQLLGKRGVCQ